MAYFITMTCSYLVTGAAGFIGFHTCLKLLSKGLRVIGLDSLNAYYDPTLKDDRLKILQSFESFHFVKGDFSDPTFVKDLFQTQEKNQTPILNVIHLGAQAGVRYSLLEPFPYITSNINGFLSILEACRYQQGFKHLVYASTSSVYGQNKESPFTEDQRTDHPMSLYAATKKANEMMAQSYHHLYDLPVTGFRFFTVYGPWGRPDMSAFKFAHAIMKDEPIDVYNFGEMERDFTYVDDIVEGILKGLENSRRLTKGKELSHPIYNLGNNKGEKLLDFISLIESCLGKTAKKNMLPLQPGDVPATTAGIDQAKQDFGYEPKTSIQEGLPILLKWFKGYYYPQK